MIRKLIIAVVYFYLVGCASQAAITKKYAISDDQQFAPINLNISGGEYVSIATAEAINYLSDSADKSGQFSRVERSFLRWPYTLEIEYSWEQPMSAGEFAGTMVSAGTLLIIPGYFNETHVLKITVLKGNVITKYKEYKAEIRTALSLWHRPIEDRKSAVNTLLEEMFVDLRNNSELPTMNDIAPPTKEKVI
jgi:hypothetical protein